LRSLAILAVSLLAVSPAFALPPVHVVISSPEAGIPPVTTGELKNFVVEKPVDWSTKAGHVDPPVQQYGDPEPAVLSATLSFASDDPDVDVAELVGPLERMTVPDVVLGRPPMVEFKLGLFTFRGVIESLTIKYAAIGADGTKARASVDLKVRKASAAEVGLFDRSGS
jgi:hypothetical protein